MIRICTSLSKNYDIFLVGRKRSSASLKPQPFKQKRLRFLVNNGPIFYLFYNLKLAFYLLFYRFDILHSVDLDTLPAGFLIAKLKRKKIVYDAHEYFTEVPELIDRPKVQKVWLSIEKFIIPKLKYAITEGPAIAKEYENKYGVEFEMVRNCPMIMDNKLKKSNTDKYLLYQGALNKGRGLEELIRAMQSVSIPLKIAGTGDIDAELKQLAQDLGVTNKVDFLGMLEPNSLPPLTQNAFVGINVSENLGMSYYYSLNNKYFDYIHAALPAITNPFPEYLALNQQFECSVFANANAQEIANAVNLLLNDTDFYLRLKKNCVLAQSQLNWQKEENILLSLYERITQ